MSARADLISGIVLLVVIGIFYDAALAIEEDPFGSGMQPYVLPRAVCLLVGALSLVYLLNAIRRLAREPAGEWDFSELKLFALWVVPMAAIAFAYIGLLGLFQYLLPTAICLSATLALFGNRGVHWLLTVPVVTSCVYYVVFFGLFRLLEPRGEVLEYDNYYLFGPLRAFLGLYIRQPAPVTG